jgi:hypothetical protein
MKNRIVKILGIVLAVAILVGLLIPAMPVSAGTLAWTSATMPSVKNFQLIQGFSANVYGVAPDGKTIFAYGAAQADVAPLVSTLYKSVDGGITWTDKNIGQGLEDLAVTMLLVPKDFATEKTIYAVVGSTIYRSRNSGSSFGIFADAAATGVGAIKSIDESAYFRYTGNIALLVAGATGIALYNDYDARWDVITAGATGLVGTNFIAAAFSPNYKNDSEILAVTSNATNTYLETMFGLPDPAHRIWNERVNFAVFLLTGGNTVTDFIIDATGARFAFPSDYSYSSNNHVYVGLSGAGPVFDVYRVNGSTAIKAAPTKATNMKLSDEDGTANIFSVAYNGTAASGTLVVSFVGDNTVYYTKDVSSSSPNWILADAPPTGTDVALTFAGAMLFAGSASDVAGFGGVFASSTDYNLFTGMSLISFAGVANVTVAKYLPTQNAPNQWVILGDGTNQVFFKSTDAGKTWMEIYVYSQAGKAINVNNVTFTADAIYLQETTAGPPFLYNADGPFLSFIDLNLAILKSTNGGYTWDSHGPTIDGAMSSM